MPLSGKGGNQTFMGARQSKSTEKASEQTFPSRKNKSGAGSARFRSSPVLSRGVYGLARVSRQSRLRSPGVEPPVAAQTRTTWKHSLRGPLWALPPNCASWGGLSCHSVSIYIGSRCGCAEWEGRLLRRVFWSFGRAVKPSRCTPHSSLKEDMEKGFVLFNASHHSRRPKGPRAAFRLLGVFDDAAGAKKHATLLPDDCDLLLAEIGRAFALTRTLPQNESEHLQRLLATHNRRLRDHEQEFLGNVAEHKTGSVSEKDRATAEGSVDGVSEEAPCKISRNAELRCQNYAVLSIIHDSDEPDGDRQEPAAVIWGVYDTEDGAKDAIKKRHSLTVKDLHLEVCAMYEWLHPTEVAKHLDDIDEEFRDETLTNIISKRKQERRSVKAFRDLCGENEAPMVDLSRPESKRVGFENATKIAELSEGSTLLPDASSVPTQHSICGSI